MRLDSFPMNKLGRGFMVFTDSILREATMRVHGDVFLAMTRLNNAEVVILPDERRENMLNFGRPKREPVYSEWRIDDETADGFTFVRLAHWLPWDKSNPLMIDMGPIYRRLIP